MEEIEFKKAMTSIESHFETAIIEISRLEIPMSNPMLLGCRLYPTDSRGLIVNSDNDLMVVITDHLNALHNSYKHELKKISEACNTISKDEEREETIAEIQRLLEDL